MREIDRWNEDDYELALLQEGDQDQDAFFLILRKPGHPDRDVTGDTEAYARRIKALVRE